ncbi:MAG: isochorismatase family cysteine hydrolase [Alphaproteobacteria bacterium]|mgnify:CR=1 FL=1|jgi:nicotinamidase-related amidase|nr:isochorismatase family cysteine hydrolase [Alphaproteobacteria bacterium]MDP6563991.1 isochorismatase family cysteine hydrolase [Alphaproteobacteria bacterium]MDP6814134.1 isochorismatase family cysteine hydrolase [Alphaproteobacteria bacterium]
MTDSAWPADKAALLIVDMQNDFVRQGAPLEVPDARATIPLHQDLTAAFRGRGRPVLYTRFLSTTYPSLLWNWSPECQPPTKCCWKGHRRSYPDAEGELDCSEVIDELTPAAGDQVVEKFGYGAFHGTPLADLLRGLGVESLAVTGTVTQICVEETAREAFHHGFATALVGDAVSSFDAELHDACLRNFAMKFGWVRSAAEVIASL